MQFDSKHAKLHFLPFTLHANELINIFHQPKRDTPFPCNFTHRKESFGLITAKSLSKEYLAAKGESQLFPTEKQFWEPILEGAPSSKREDYSFLTRRGAEFP
ncbi:hypothetical protein CDAR_242621 [Caerostris darwini]|uniref:Uncharacterized protein n=1 Tax=Caerostris darwini TaxID=1538125 RepID=A0AAV4MZV5_9ARAC|nr:hypothetical protein CDAR_242621 [Caerostris darwini]